MDFDAKISHKDMYGFNLYHSYHSSTGRLTVFIPLVVYGIAIYETITKGSSELSRLWPYLAIVTVMIFFNPISLYFQSKNQMADSPVLSDYLHYHIDDRGIEVSSNHAEEPALLNWKGVMKVVERKTTMLVFSGKVNAYIIPKDQIGDTEQFKKLCADHLESYRIHFKK